MYAEHQPQLSALGRSGPDGFARICTFVLLTIRVSLWDAHKDYPLVRSGNRRVRSVFGFKHQGLDYVEANAEDLYERCEAAFELSNSDEDAEDTLLGILCDIPNIGPAKAGFIAQMVYGLSGCIDTHNLDRFGLHERTFRLDKKRLQPYPKRRFDIIRRYNAFCREEGGSRRLWDDWCCLYSERDPVNYPTPDRVSALHLAPLAV
jgi:hypothetical protein